MLVEAREAVEDFLNAEGRGTSHVLLGAAVVLGVGLTAAALSSRGARAVDQAGLRGEAGRGVVEAPRTGLSALAPILFSATTLSVLRVWNAPNAPERRRALGLWAGLQLLNAGIVALRPRRFGGQIAAAMAAAGLTSAYAFEARKLDRRAGTIVQPAGGGVGLSNLARDVARRRVRA